MSNITIQNSLLPLSEELLSMDSAKSREKEQEMAKATSSKKTKGIEDMKLVSQDGAKPQDPAKVIMETLELIQELEVLLITLHTKDTTNQAKISTVLEKQGMDEVKKIKSEIVHMEKLKREEEHRSGIMHIIGIVVGALSIFAAAFMGPGALLIASAMFAMQETGTLNKATAHMGAGAKLGFTIGLALAGGLAGAGIDGAIGAAIDDGTQATTTSVSDQMASSFKAVGYTTFAQSLATINPTQALLEKAGMSKKDAAIVAGVINALVAIVAILKAGKTGSNVFERNAKTSSFLEKLMNSEKAQRLLSGLQGGAGIAQGALGFQMMSIQKSMYDFETKMASTNSTLFLIHEIMQNVESLVHLTSQAETTLQKSFGDEVKALGTLPMAWESAARVLTNSAA